MRKKKAKSPNIVRKGRRNPHGFSASLMSNTKWRKLFVALERPGLELSLARIKFVDGDKVHVIGRPRVSCHGREPWPFIDTMEFGPFPLREIEWIEFPATFASSRGLTGGSGRVPGKIVKQDIDKAEAILTRLGQFPMERVGDALRITGHIR